MCVHLFYVLCVNCCTNVYEITIYDVIDKKFDVDNMLGKACIMISGLFKNVHGRIIIVE